MTSRSLFPEPSDRPSSSPRPRGSPASAYGAIPETALGSTADQQHHQLEMIRIHDMWQGTKHQLRESKGRLMEVERRGVDEAARQRRDHDSSVQSLQGVTLELRDKLRFTELQLAGAREEGTRLAHNVQELRGRLADAQNDSVEGHERRRRQEAAVAELQGALQRASAEKQQALDRLQEEQRRIDSVAATKEQTVALQEQKVRALQAELRKVRDEQAGRAQHGDSLMARLADQERVNGELTQQLMLHKEQLKALHGARRSEAQMQSTLQQLHLDNARLLKLLSSTHEFRGFTHYAEDAGGVVYVPPARAPNGSADGLRAALELRPPDEVTRRAGARPVPREPAREADFWVPADAYAVANEFRHAHVPQVPLESFAELLIKLNRVWKARETKALERQREAANRRVGDLRRKLQQSTPYEEVLQGSQVERLKRELREMRATYAQGRRRLSPTEERLLESSLESVEELSAQLDATRDEGSQLRAELEQGARARGASFMRGASSAAQRAAELTDRLGERLGELTRDFQARAMAQSRQDPEYYMKTLRLQGWFVDNVERRVAACRERMAGVYEAVAADHPDQFEPGPPGGGPPASYAHNGSFGGVVGGGGGGGGSGVPDSWLGDGLASAWSAASCAPAASVAPPPPPGYDPPPSGYHRGYGGGGAASSMPRDELDDFFDD